MRKLLFLGITACLFSFSACNSSDSQSSSTQTSGENVATQEETKLSDMFYKRLSGKLGDKIEVVMHLTRHDSVLDGNYYYVSQGKKIELYGTIDSEGNFTLNEDEGQGFKGKFSNGKTCSGKWEGKNGKSFPFSLSENYEDGAVPLTFNFKSQSKKTKNGKGEAEVQEAILQLKTPIGSINDSLNTFAQDIPTYLNNSLKDLEEMLSEVEVETMNYASDQSQSVILNEKNLLSVSTLLYEYMGGAHGSSAIVYQNFDLKTGKQLSLNDILVSGWGAKLNPIAEKAFRAQNGVTGSYEEQGFSFEGNTFVLAENWALTKAGILFTYGQYEIGPYAMGMPEFTLPYAEMKDLIKPGSALATFK